MRPIFHSTDLNTDPGSKQVVITSLTLKTNHRLVKNESLKALQKLA